MKRRRFLQTSAAAAVTAALPFSLLSKSTFAAAIAEMRELKNDIRAFTGDGTDVVLERAAVNELKAALLGQLLLPGQAGYDKARMVLNSDIDKYPALIVRPSGAADVSTAVEFARDRSLLVAVKCGGHSWAGKSTCQGGMQIDLSSFRNVRVDPVARRAYAAGGSLLGELDHEAMSHGLVTTAGTVSHTGIGGLTLGGGFGRVARRFGLALDNVTGAQAVTADGQLRNANPEENEDLYWGIRGGGGNFGVVTNFEFALHPMQREVVAGSVVWPLSQAKQALRHYGDLLTHAPDELYLDYIMVSEAGSSDGVAMIYACYSGPPDKAEGVLKPISGVGKPLQADFSATDYVAEQRAWDSSDPRSDPEYLKSGFFSEFTEGLIDAVVDDFQAVPERKSQVFFQCSGGAISRVPAQATAFAHRSAIAGVFVTASWPDGEERSGHVQSVRDHWAAIEPHTRGWYTNDISNESQDAVNKNYANNFQRLVQVKNTYDPTNLFRLNANVKPTA